MLPVLDSRTVETFKLPYLKKTIKIKPYKGAQEKRLLNCLTNKKDRKKWLVNLLEIIKENVVDCDIDLSKLKIVDFLFITYKLRSISKSDRFDYQVKCSGIIKNEDGTTKKCSHIFKDSISMDNLLKVKNIDVVQKIVDVNENLSLELVPPDLRYLSYMADLGEKEFEQVQNSDRITDPEKEEIKNIFELFASKIAFSVSKVIINEDGKKNVYTEFTEDEVVNNILMNLTVDEIQKILKELGNLISLSIGIKKVCPECGKVYEEEDGSFFQFLT